MNEQLLLDLAAFERGELPRADLVGRHGEDASAIVAVHDRVAAAAAAVGVVVDADAGWAALQGQLDAIVVPFVPRARSRRRTLALAVAAAMLAGGAALAAVGADWFRDEPVVPPTPAPTHVSRAGSGLGRPAAAASDRTEGVAVDKTEAPRTPGGTTDGGSEEPGATGDGGTGTSEDPDPKDDPNDRDQGTGNDGDHDDRGGGNDGAEGEDRQGGLGGQGQGGPPEERGNPGGPEDRGRPVEH